MAESDLIRGNVDTVILKILYEGDRYGYEIIKQISERSGRQLEIKQPTIYACLKRLEKQGFISSYWDSSESSGGRRKYYSLTDRGREVFITYKNEWERSRDLFGELIMGDEQILGGDDFLDVEEESYDIPKRKSRRKPPVKKPTPTDPDPTPIDPTPTDPTPIDPTPTDLPDGPAPTEPKNDPNDDGSVIYDHNGEFPPYLVDSSLTEEPPAPAPQEPTELLQADEPKDPDYVQESFLFDNGSGHSVITNDPQEPTEIGDPRAIMEELYASTFTGADSYSRAFGRTYDETYIESEPAAAYEERRDEAPTQSNAPAPAREPAPSPSPVPASPVEPRETPQSELFPVDESESLARREYKDILNGLAEMSDRSVARGDEAAAATDEPAEETDGVVTRFEEVRRAVEELGNEVTVREHNDSAKVYTHRYQYFSNRLMLTQYTIMCSIMFVLGLIMFLTFYFGLNMRMRYDNVLYIFTGLFPIVMFIIVVIAFVGDPDKKRNININFRSSIITRLVMMLQIMVVFYCLNLIWGMPVTFSAYYVPSIVIPFVYSTFMPISKVIFMGLLKSGRYNAD